MIQNINQLLELPAYKNHKRYGHWIYGGVDDVSCAFGFTYCITDILNHRKYIGCKQIKTKRKSDWKSYTGSNTELNKDIETYGMDHFLFEILNVYFDKTSLRIGEATEILNRQALQKQDYYNEYLQLRVRIPRNQKQTILPKLAAD